MCILFIYIYQRLNHDSEIQIRKKTCSRLHLSLAFTRKIWGISPTKRHQPLRRIWRKALGRRGFLIRRDWPSSQVSSMGCPQCQMENSCSPVIEHGHWKSPNRFCSLTSPLKTCIDGFPIHVLVEGISILDQSPGGRAQARLSSRHNTISCAVFSNSSRSELNWAFGGNGWKWWICPMKPWGKLWLTGGFWGILYSDKP